MRCRKCFWNLCFKVEDYGQSHWNKRRHRRGNCEMHIFTARYYRLWGLLLSAFPMISDFEDYCCPNSRWSQTLGITAVCIPNDLSMTLYRCRPHERPGSGGQRSLVAATSQSVRFARSLAIWCNAGQPHLHTCVCPFKWVGEKCVCTLVAGAQDVT
jgi:hypothetical protein